MHIRSGTDPPFLSGRCTRAAGALGALGDHVNILQAASPLPAPRVLATWTPSLLQGKEPANAPQTAYNVAILRQDTSG